MQQRHRRPVPEVAKRHGVSAQTIYSWHDDQFGMDRACG